MSVRDKNETSSMYTQKTAEKLLIKLTSRPRKERTINRWKPKTKFIDGLYYSCKTFQDNIDKIL